LVEKSPGMMAAEIGCIYKLIQHLSRMVTTIYIDLYQFNRVVTSFFPICNAGLWLGWQDSNLRMPASKAGALPLGDTPAARPVGRSERPYSHRKLERNPVLAENQPI
jgi:hypothetical protein